jgi:hypothetical protein
VRHGLTGQHHRAQQDREFGKILHNNLKISFKYRLNNSTVGKNRATAFGRLALGFAQSKNPDYVGNRSEPARCQGRQHMAAKLFRQEALAHQAQRHWGRCTGLGRRSAFLQRSHLFDALARAKCRT